jgi:hypothetical protein
MSLLGVNDENAFKGMGMLLGDKDGGDTTTLNQNTPKYSAPTTGPAAAGRGGGRVLGENTSAPAPVAQTGGPLLRAPVQQQTMPAMGKGLAGGLFGSGAGGFGGGIAGAVNNAFKPVANMAGGNGVTKMSGNLFGQIKNAATTLGGQVAQQPNQQQPRATGLKFGPLGGFGGFGGFGMV